MIRLPSRKSDVIIVKSDYSYREIVSNDNIDIRQINSIIFSTDDLSCDMTLLMDLCKKTVDIDLKFKDFETVLYIDSVLKSKINNKSFLMDDTLRKDRSYIDLTKLKNIRLNIPLNYLMWGIKFNDFVDIYCFSFLNQFGYEMYTSVNGNKKLSFENYIKIRKKIEELSKINVNDSKEKVALISDYVQSCIQFISGYKSHSINGVVITPDFPSSSYYNKVSGLAETVLNNNNGVCMGIANLSTLLLNNENMNLEVESVFSKNHVWNKILIDGEYYYFDNTWSITRNENVSDEGLIALSFSKKYLLFGNKTANMIGEHDPRSVFIYGGTICDDDLCVENYESKFVYMKHPKYRSIRK